MSEPSSPTGDARCGSATVVVDDVQDEVAVDASRWASLAAAALDAEGVAGELTLTFVDRAEITALKVEHFGDPGDHPTDVLSFPLDSPGLETEGMPVLLGDVVICPAVALEQCESHAGTLDDELALLVVHGVLHILGHDHTEPAEAAVMKGRELALLESLHWLGAAPSGFSVDHREEVR